MATKNGMKKLSNRTKVLIFILFNVVSIALVFYFTFTPETLEALKGFNYPFLAVLFCVWLLSASTEALSFICFIKGAGSSIGFFDSFQLTVIKNMFNVITPLNAGGHPVAIYALSRRGVPVGRGTSIVMTKMIIYSFVSLIGGVLSFFYYSRGLDEQSIIRTFFLITAGAFTLLMLFFFLVISFPNRLIAVLAFIGGLFRKVRANPRAYRSMKRVLVHEVFISRKSMRLYFHEHRGYFALGILLTTVFYCLNVILLWVILRGMDLEIPFFRGCVLSAVQQALLAFQPTPGGAGIGDGTFYLLFQENIPKHLMGIAILQWRFFSQYLSALAGSAFLGVFFSHRKEKVSE